jgi:hypothetical protein
MFYILTCGSTASVWLARALSRHPEIVCFHGVKTIAANPRIDPAEPLARQFVRELVHLYQCSEGECVFGGIHGFGAAEIAPEIAAIDGAFAAMIRHPIARLNSLFHREADNLGEIDLPSGDIYSPFREAESNSPAANPFQSGSPFAAYVRRFYDLCRSVVDEDAFILDNMAEPDIFRYESITADPAYFRACFERLAEACRRAMAVNTRRHGAVRLDCSDAYVEQVFAAAGSNRKTSEPMSEGEIFASWPAAFRDIFADRLAQTGGAAAADRYRRFGYRLPSAALLPASPGAILSVLGPGAALLEPNRAGADKPAARLSEGMESQFEQLRTNVDWATRCHALIVRGFANGQIADRAAVIDGTRESQEKVETVRRLLNELHAACTAERAAAVARIRELEANAAASRDAFTAQTTALQATFAAERAAAVARIRELEGTLAAEHDAFVSRIRELERDADAYRSAFAAQTAALQATFAAERAAAVSRIRELEERQAG